VCTKCVGVVDPPWSDYGVASGWGVEGQRDGRRPRNFRSGIKGRGCRVQMFLPPRQGAAKCYSVTSPGLLRIPVFLGVTKVLRGVTVLRGISKHPTSSFREIPSSNVCAHAPCASRPLSLHSPGDGGSRRHTLYTLYTLVYTPLYTLQNAESPCKQALVTLVHTCCTQNHPRRGEETFRLTRAGVYPHSVQGSEFDVRCSMFRSRQLPIGPLSSRDHPRPTPHSSR
jgi:hypothetical protein